MPFKYLRYEETAIVAHKVTRMLLICNMETHLLFIPKYAVKNIFWTNKTSIKSINTEN